MTTAHAFNLFQTLPAVAAHAITLRHNLHQHPELGYEEVFTSGVIKQELQRLGIEFEGGFARGTGIVGIIRGEHGQGPCVALRADMDALPISEQTGLPYASLTPGRMHACGHDGHMAVLLGAAAILQAARAHFRGTIKLIFQPAEEGGCGAEKMCEEGVLEGVGAIFGLHGWPGLKVETVSTRGGPLLASVDGFTIQLTGRGGHAAAPQETIDPIVAGAALVQALQTIVSRETDPNDAAVVTVAQFHGGSNFNVIPETAEINGTIRTLSEERRKVVLEALERMANGVAAAHRCTASVRYFGTTPATVNNTQMADFARVTAREVLGETSFLPAAKAAMWGEDFAFYLQRVPGCFFVMGVKPDGFDSYPMLHSPHFDFTDAAVPVGIRMMAELAVRFLKG